jgi:UDP-N-acetylmuramoyl-L-alanyl-D-glutamate--2,6-diaminopimelate ligase
VHYEIGDRVIPAQRTTPESLEVQHMMAQMVKAGCQACVMEVSSHALEQKRVFGIQFDVAIFTNLTRDHLDFHGTMEDYFAAKRKLFEALGQGDKKAAAVINIDDDFGARLTGLTNVEVELTYGLQKTARLRASNLQLSHDGSRFTVEADDRKFACRLPLIGRHNIYNALAAVGRGPRDEYRSRKNPGRVERNDARCRAGSKVLRSGQPFGVFVDYAHTDDALKNVLSTLREITNGRVLVAFGCGGNRDSGKRAKMGRIAAETGGLHDHYER